MRETNSFMAPWPRMRNSQIRNFRSPRTRRWDERHLVHPGSFTNVVSRAGAPR
jgi:hypothetical protein